MGHSTDPIDYEVLCDILEMSVLEGKSSNLLEIYASERANAFRKFIDPQSTQNKLRVQSDPAFAREI